jgi:hypothetical protein
MYKAILAKNRQSLQKFLPIHLICDVSTQSLYSGNLVPNHQIKPKKQAQQNLLIHQQQVT